MDKNKEFQRFLAANIESLEYKMKGNIDDKNLEHFHVFLCGYTDIFTDNIYATKDYTYHNVCDMIQTKNIVVAKGEKDSTIVTTKRSDYVTLLYYANIILLYYCSKSSCLQEKVFLCEDKFTEQSKSN